MRVSWRNLDWISEAERAEIEQQIQQWAVGDRGLDRVDFVGEDASPAPAGNGATAASPRMRVIGRIGKAQVTAVRAAASREAAFVAAFGAFEESAKWALDQVRRDKVSAFPGKSGAARAAAATTSGQPGGGSRYGVLSSVPMPSLSLPRLTFPSLSLPSLRLPSSERAADSASRGAPAASARRPSRSTSRSSQRRGAAAGRGRAAARGRGAGWLPTAAAVAGFALVGFSTLDPRAWIEVRFFDMEPSAELVAFSATASGPLLARFSDDASTADPAGRSSGEGDWVFRAVAGSDAGTAIAARSRGFEPRPGVGATGAGPAPDASLDDLLADPEAAPPELAGSRGDAPPSRSRGMEPEGAVRRGRIGDAPLGDSAFGADAESPIAYRAVAGADPSDSSAFRSLLSFSARAR